jgi:hypothetical protein
LESWTAEQNGQQQPVCNLWALEWVKYAGINLTSRGVKAWY